MVKRIEDKKLVILGSTGSIGTQALDVCDYHGISVEALSVDSNIDLLEEQIRKFGVKYCAVVNEEKAKVLKERIRDTSTKVFARSEGILEMISLCEGDTVFVFKHSHAVITGIDPVYTGCTA